MFMNLKIIEYELGLESLPSSPPLIYIYIYLFKYLMGFFCSDFIPTSH
jgi:hypothetical protein